MSTGPAPAPQYESLISELKPEQPLEDRPIEVDDEGNVLTSSDGGGAAVTVTVSRRRQSTMFSLKSASSFGTQVEVSNAELARIFGVSTVLVFLITFGACALMSAGGLVGCA